MKIKLSDYIADFLVHHDITDMFMVTGGGAMHLDDSFGHKEGLCCTFNHNEQASAMAAEAYARVNNKIAAVCVTTGPGATNAITGCICGWMDSIPMLVISGQARYETTVYASGLKLRTRGVQEFDIIGSVRNMTKYCELIDKPEKIRYALEKAYYLASHGRPGPCWLDIPLDVQAAMIVPSELPGYEPDYVEPHLDKTLVPKILAKLQQAKRPVIFAGNGIRLAGAHEDFIQLVDHLGIPVVTGMSSVDGIASDHPLFAGRNGTTGDRAGNFAIQNADVLLSLGSRLSYFQTGFNHQAWARDAYKMINDIDAEELKKDSMHADLPICCNVRELIQELLQVCPQKLSCRTDWIEQCQKWRKSYPVVQPKHYEDKKPNIYVFYQEMTKRLLSTDRLVVSVGSSRTVGSQTAIIKEGMRFITNPSTAAMGYCLPAAIGVCIASKRKRTILVTGEGSLQMNLQELQTIITNNLPIHIFVMNNGGYHSIRLTQNNYFGKPLIGVGPESRDLEFPDLAKLAPAYGYEFQRCSRAEDVKAAIAWNLQQDGPVITEMMLSSEYKVEPKVASKMLNNGQMASARLEDMAPFLSEEEVRENMVSDREKF